MTASVNGQTSDTGTASEAGAASGTSAASGTGAGTGTGRGTGAGTGSGRAGSAKPVRVKAVLVDEADESACVCGHLPEQHDTIASRYCDATIAGGLDRGCVCRVAAEA